MHKSFLAALAALVGVPAAAYADAPPKYVSLLPGPCEIPVMATRAALAAKIDLHCGSRALAINADRLNASYNAKLNRYLVVATQNNRRSIYIIDPEATTPLAPASEQVLGLERPGPEALDPGLITSLKDFEEKGIVHIWHRGRP